jgi:hypothetical protein
MRKTLCLAFLLIGAAGIFASSATEEGQPDKMCISKPVLQSLVFSHGAGFYALGENRRAAPYLVAHIVFVDIPLFALAAGMAANMIDSTLFSGSVLSATEYVVNALLICVLIAVPAIRIIECIGCAI